MPTVTARYCGTRWQRAAVLRVVAQHPQRRGGTTAVLGDADPLAGEGRPGSGDGVQGVVGAAPAPLGGVGAGDLPYGTPARARWRLRPAP